MFPQDRSCKSDKGMNKRGRRGISCGLFFDENKKSINVLLFKKTESYNHNLQIITKYVQVVQEGLKFSRLQSIMNKNKYESPTRHKLGKISVRKEEEKEMRCQRCGYECENNARFCPKCGAEIGYEQLSESAPTTVLTNVSAEGSGVMLKSVQKKKSSTLAICLTIIMAVLIVVAGCVTAVVLLNKGDSETSTVSANNDAVQNAEQGESTTTAENAGGLQTQDGSEEEQFQEIIENIGNHLLFGGWEFETVLEMLPDEVYADSYGTMTDENIQDAKEVYEAYVGAITEGIYSTYGSDAELTIEIDSVESFTEEDVEEGTLAKEEGEQLKELLGYFPEGCKVTYTAIIDGSQATAEDQDAFLFFKLDGYGWYSSEAFEMLLSN